MEDRGRTPGIEHVFFCGGKRVCSAPGTRNFFRNAGVDEPQPIPPHEIAPHFPVLCVFRSLEKDKKTRDTAGNIHIYLPFLSCPLPLLFQGEECCSSDLLAFLGSGTASTSMGK